MKAAEVQMTGQMEKRIGFTPDPIACCDLDQMELKQKNMDMKPIFIFPHSTGHISGETPSAVITRNINMKTHLLNQKALLLLGLTALATTVNVATVQTGNSGLHPVAKRLFNKSILLLLMISMILTGFIANAQYPVATTAQSNSNGNATSHVVSLPSGVEVGDLLIAIMGFRDRTFTTTTVTFPTGWTELVTRTNTTGQGVVFYKIATATEAGAASITVAAAPTGGTGARSAHTVYRIAKGTFQGTPEATYINATTMVTSAANPNPPSLTPSWGSAKNLWIVGAAGYRPANAPNTTTFVPTNFTNGTYEQDASATGASSASVSTATRQFEGTTLDPGTFTLDATLHRAFTIAIQGAPTLAVIPTTLDFGYVAYPGTSGEQSYILSGSALTAGPITVTAPVGFQVSLTSGYGFASSVTVPYTVPTLGNTTIYVLFVPAAANTSYSNNITNAGGGATTVNVAVSGTSAVPAGACTFTNNTSASLTVTPCINMPSNPMSVSTTIDTRRYFVMNVIKGLTYQIYTTEAPGTTDALKLTVYNESDGTFVAYSESNAGNPTSGDIDDAYLSFTSTFSGQVRVLINHRSGCATTTKQDINTNVNVTGGSNTQDSQTTAVTNTWIGHIYDGTNAAILYNGNFANYLGYYTQTETFNESFGGGTLDNTCFSPVTSNNVTRATVEDGTFSVRYRMNSNKKGLYIADIGSDDGSRLTVDNNLIYNDWVNQPYSPINPRILMNLTGNSSLLLDYYEDTQGNQLSFQNLTRVLENNLSTNTTQSVCLGSSGTAISGDTYGTLPSGITLSGTGYQWAWSTSLSGPWTDIAGATAATYTPTTATAPFNAANTYYIIRKAKLASAANNIGVPNYVATNESNAVTLTVHALPTINIVQTNVSCYGGSDGSIKVTVLTGAPNYTFSKDGTNYITPTPSTATEHTFSGLNVAGGPYTIKVKDNNGCISQP